MGPQDKKEPDGDDVDLDELFGHGSQDDSGMVPVPVAEKMDS
jgi:hypothetical protein